MPADTRAEIRIPAGYTLDEIIDHAIRLTVRRCGSKRKAAQLLNISNKTIYNRIGTGPVSKPISRSR